MRPRCRYCGQPVANAGDACGVCAGSRIAQADEDAARQGKLLVGDVLAAEEAREKVFGEVQAVLKTVAYDGRTLNWDAINALVDRIFEAVTLQGHKPYQCTVCYTTGHSKDGKCVNGHDVTPECQTTEVDTTAHTSPEREWLPGDSDTTPASPPVVDLDADDLRGLASAVDACENLSGNATGIVSAEIGLNGGATAYITTNAGGVWVLRIGRE